MTSCVPASDPVKQADFGVPSLVFALKNQKIKKGSTSKAKGQQHQDKYVLFLK